MELSDARRAALVVPDELSWTMWGTDPASLGLEPAASAESASAVLSPAVVPSPLVEALAAELARIPGQPATTLLDAPSTGGVPFATVGAPPAEHRGHAREAGHGTAGHESAGDEGRDMGHDMMAIVGDPSADGLVMEPIDLSIGPLASPLPGGLVASVSLDGDVVSSCTLTASLRAATDPLCPAAWRVACAVADEHAAETSEPAATHWRRIAEVEAERARSHVAWTRSLGRLLGWAQLVEAAQDALDAAEADASRAVGRVIELVESRRFARVAAERGRVDGAAALVGPNARGATPGADARARDVAYAELGFAPGAAEAPDARGRALVRVREAARAVGLHREATARATGSARCPAPAFATAAGAVVEGPRGAVLASRSPSGRTALALAPGHHATLAAAGRAATGLEWSAALLALHSFDLSPWKTDP